MTGPGGSSGSGTTTLHASSVCFGGRGLLIMGAAGSGKSGLALRLMAMGAGLISDDRTHISVQEGRLIASAPPAIEGLIEARGVGILKAKSHGPHPLNLAVDLDRPEIERLPEIHEIFLLGHSLRLLHNVDRPHFAAAILQYLRAGIGNG